MSISYSWRVTTYKAITVGQKRPVVQVYWEKIGTDTEGRTGKFSGVSTFSNFDEENFIEYEDLTNNIIESWVAEDMLPNEDSINAKIIEQIENQIIN